jgi:4-carboxymuconolactone decarboxylase
MTNEIYERGLAIRKDVLGKEFVESSFAKATDFNRAMQDLTTEYCWGYVWGRETFDRKTRSIINLAMISALNRPHELEMHVRGALRNGLTPADIREIFLQVAIYCGVPAGVDSFRIGTKVLAEEEFAGKFDEAGGAR